MKFLLNTQHLLVLVMSLKTKLLLLHNESMFLFQVMHLFMRLLVCILMLPRPFSRGGWVVSMSWMLSFEFWHETNNTTILRWLKFIEWMKTSMKWRMVIHFKCWICLKLVHMKSESWDMQNNDLSKIYNLLDAYQTSKNYEKNDFPVPLGMPKLLSIKICTHYWIEEV